ncbi:MAG: DoxX family protein [Tannerellaceae bacterium]|nr:DoxX family protein [Tannerellaceae bacterium]
MVKNNNFFHTIARFLFPEPPVSNRVSLFLLVARVIFGVLLMTHGIQKASHFTTLQSGFYDPLRVGSTVSLSLAIFAEIACSLGFILGAFYRLALIPMMFTMLVAFFSFHREDPFAAKELPFVYFCIFLLMFLAGPGKYALDYFITKQISRSNNV